MLKNLNSLIKNVILEQVTDDKDEKYIKLIYHCNEFYNKYLVDLADECNIGVTKQRNNVFLTYGTVANLIKYFDKLKVDEMFMEDPKEFSILAPMYSFGDDTHLMQRGEAFPITGSEQVPTTHDVDNKVRSIVYGRWNDFYQNEKNGQKLLKVQPSKFKKYIKDVQKLFKLDEDSYMFIEFSVNCEDWKNNIFEDMAEFRTEDEINDNICNKEDSKFDYPQCNVPKSNDDSHRAALKDIKIKKS